MRLHAAGDEQNIAGIDGLDEKTQRLPTHSGAFNNHLEGAAVLYEGEEDDPAMIANKPHPTRESKFLNRNIS